MNTDTIEQFVADLAVATIGTTVNQYSCHDDVYDRPDGASTRRENLRRYLVDRQRPKLLLVGEAPSYRGCRFSGIPFTSERRHLPRDAWSSTHPIGWTEPSATIVHRVLAALDIEATTMLWNIVPTHPNEDRPMSNRTPTTSEIEAGAEWLDRLVTLTNPVRVIAVGQSAATRLPGSSVVRHPAYGGARLFASQLSVALGLEPSWSSPRPSTSRRTRRA